MGSRGRDERAQVYEVVLREGRPEVILTFVDGALLVDLWEELVLPREVRGFWVGTIDRYRPAIAA